MSHESRIVFEPSGRSVFALPGTVVLEAAARAGFIVQTPCGGNGTCGKCLVNVRSGKCPPTDAELRALGGERVAEGCRLACQARLNGPATIEIPDGSLFGAQQQILTADSGGPVTVVPRVHKHYIALGPPKMGEPLSDLERLRRRLPEGVTRLAALRALPGALRRSGFSVTAVELDGELIAVEPGDTSSLCYGVAFDIGSTTLVGTLVNLITGVDLALASRVNPQTSFGDDVVSRIQLCRAEAGGLARLHGAVLEAVNKMLDELARKAGVSRQNIYELVFAGNTTMQQILCGVDPSALGEIPFVPAFRNALEMRASDLGLHACPEACVHVFAQIGGFVGGDTVAGIVATRLDEAQEPALLVDIGTNGEIVLAAKGRMLATSVAAGPAFEGARIVNGMRAAPGAIEKVIVNGDLKLNVIGNVKPSGLCGTGLIDAAAELLRLGVLDTTGRILGPEEAPASVPDPIKRRLMEGHGGEFSVLLAGPSESATGQPLLLYQRDIRELQLACGAIRAGVNILLGMLNLKPGDLGSVLLAGAFGNFIRRSNARRIGMLPAIPCSRIRFVGNAASFGAKRALLSRVEKDYADRVFLSVEHVDLSLSPDFQMEFAAAMMLPEADEAGDCVAE